MAINLSLNDFRNVLGKVNDGNVVFKQDQSGIEKANYGSKILNLIRTTRTAPNDPAENLQIRSMLLSAIQNSAEGKVLSEDTLNRIYVALGMTEGLNTDDLCKPLSRRELKNAIDIIDDATKHNALITKDKDALKAANLWDKNAANSAGAAINRSG